jgi:AraC-like DNA-binding protein
VLGIRPKPVGAFAVLGGTLEPLTGVTTDLQDVAGWDARRLVDRCDAARSPEARLRVAAAWIAERISAGPSPDAAVDWVSRSMERSHGMASIGDLTERSGWSSTRLVETFRRQVGVPPKRFARIMRFQHALGLVTTGRAPLSGIALEAGYCDQSHFNGDFREMSGLTPTAYRAALRFPGSANLAEHSE